MSMIAPFQHWQTFARLHDARPADAEALAALSTALPLCPDGHQPNWPALIQADDAHVLVATECQLVVGAAVLWHHKGAALARLAWLGVSLDARRRGIGQLLLETGIARATLAGARQVVTHLPDGALALDKLLAESGFAPAKGGHLRLDLGRPPHR